MKKFFAVMFIISLFIIFLTITYEIYDNIQNDNIEHLLRNNKYSIHNINLLTLNLRSENLDYGRNHWNYRKFKIRDILNKYESDIISTQEGLVNQLKDIELLLPEYNSTCYLKESSKSKEFENLVIFYKSNRLKLLNSNYFWLSNTPNEEFSISHDSAHPRIAAWALFKFIQKNFTFLVINTHLDHISSKSREFGSFMITKFIEDNFANVPVFIMGDFNEPNNLMAHNHFTNLNYNDVYSYCLQSNCKLGRIVSSTFHNFMGKVVNYPLIRIFTYLNFIIFFKQIPIWDRYHIDWILMKNQFSKYEILPEFFEVCVEKEDYVELLLNLLFDLKNYKKILKNHLTFSSDHYAVFTSLKII